MDFSCADVKNIERLMGASLVLQLEHDRPGRVRIVKCRNSSIPDSELAKLEMEVPLLLWSALCGVSEKGARKGGLAHVFVDPERR